VGNAHPTDSEGTPVIRPDPLSFFMWGEGLDPYSTLWINNTFKGRIYQWLRDR